MGATFEAELLKNFKGNPEKMSRLWAIYREVQDAPYFYAMFVFIGIFTAGPLGFMIGWFFGRFF